MSEWKVQVVQVAALTKHPNADRLTLTKVFDYPVITAVGDFLQGESDGCTAQPHDAKVKAF
jgi:hypothetical protein